MGGGYVHGVGVAIQLILPPLPLRAAWWQPTLLIHVAWVRRVKNEKQGDDYGCDFCHPLSVHLYRVPVLICSARPCGVGGGRRFFGTLWIHGEQCPDHFFFFLFFNEFQFHHFYLFKSIFRYITISIFKKVKIFRVTILFRKSDNY